MRSGYVLDTYEDLTGRKLPMYLMNRDGFTLLAMGFTGKKAIGFKIAYIEAFNQMEKMLRENQATEYAKAILKAKVEEFNKRMREGVAYGKKQHGAYYGACGDMIPHLPFLDGFGYEHNVQNILAFVSCAFSDSMFFISKLFKKEDELKEANRKLRALTHMIQDFATEVENKLSIHY